MSDIVFHYTTGAAWVMIRRRGTIEPKGRGNSWPYVWLTPSETFEPRTYDSCLTLQPGVVRIAVSRSDAEPYREAFSDPVIDDAVREVVATSPWLDDPRVIEKAKQHARWFAPAFTGFYVNIAGPHLIARKAIPRDRWVSVTRWNGTTWELIPRKQWQDARRGRFIRNNIVSAELLKRILRDYQLSLDGIHGPAHWGRVFENGQRLAEQTGARRDVVALFAVLHDARRVNDWSDDEHGCRGADLAIELCGEAFDLDEDGMELLTIACREHSIGTTTSEPTIGTCWDADRLDLPRVGVRIRPNRLCTEAARQTELIEWATQRARSRTLPPILERWRIDV